MTRIHICAVGTTTTCTLIVFMGAAGSTSNVWPGRLEPQLGVGLHTATTLQWLILAGLQISHCSFRTCRGRCPRAGHVGA